jgi:GWxTD domain-containing protein
LYYQDFSFLYDPDSPVLQEKSYLRKDTASVFLAFTKAEQFRSFQEVNRRYILSLHAAPEYSTGNIVMLDTIPVFTVTEIETPDKLILEFKVPIGNSASVVLLKVDDLRKGLSRVLELGQVFRKNSPEKIFLMEEINSTPVVSSYFAASKPFKLVTTENIDSLKFSYYGNIFPPAAPPHAFSEPSFASITLTPDTTGSFIVDSLVEFTREGLVVFSNNKAVPGCFSFLYQDKKFPAVTTVDELIDPLIYITSREEFEKLNNAPNKKKALDNFWLSIGGSIPYSKKLIKTYYSRVEFANRSFSTYKEGWKTDKGMIFIIFGKPDAVNRSEDTEDWYFQSPDKKQFYNFTFIRKPLLLSEQNYELVRKDEFSQIWYPIIDKWRKGIIFK